MSLALSGTSVLGTRCACTAQLLSCTAAPRVDPGLKDIPELSRGGTPKPLTLTVVQHGDFSRRVPWGYERETNTFLVISALDAVVLLSLKIFDGEEPSHGRTKVQGTPTWTDNHGSGSALNMSMSTRSPPMR